MSNADLDHINDIHDAAYNAGIVEGEAAACSHIPTVIVSIVGGVAYVDYADGPVNVIVADYDLEQDGVQDNTEDPNGDPVNLYEVAAEVNPEKVRQYLAILSEAGR